MLRKEWPFISDQTTDYALILGTRLRRIAYDGDISGFAAAAVRGCCVGFEHYVLVDRLRDIVVPTGLVFVFFFIGKCCADTHGYRR